MTLGPACTNFVLARGNLRPAQADLHPAHALTCILPGAENQPEVTLGALFHGFFHVLRGVQ